MENNLAITSGVRGKNIGWKHPGAPRVALIFGDE